MSSGLCPSHGPFENWLPHLVYCDHGERRRRRFVGGRTIPCFVRLRVSPGPFAASPSSSAPGFRRQPTFSANGASSARRGRGIGANSVRSYFPGVRLRPARGPPHIVAAVVLSLNRIVEGLPTNRELTRKGV